MREIAVKSLHFEVRGVPVAWSRTRIATSGFGRIRLVNAAKLTAYEDQVASVAAIAARAQGWKLIDTGLSLSLVFWMPIPPSASGRKRTAMMGTPHAQRPDLDNLTKAILDGITKAGVWRDDAQVTHLSAIKWWRTEPGVDVEVTG